MRLIPKPLPGEYPVYPEMYMKHIPSDGFLLKHLRDNFETLKELVSALPEAKLLHRYKKCKWSIKEILVHLVDDERIFSYRALCTARNEQQEINGFDQDSYAFYSRADDRSCESILAECEAVRLATITLFQNLPEEALLRKGHGTGSFHGATVRALGYHIAGHEVHHLNFIKENYL
jgi:uncharacterized damage-inducible protein DinB